MTNTERIAEYIAGGCTDKRQLGVEIEHFAVKDDLSQVPYSGGINDILKGLSVYYPEREYSMGELIALYDDEASITIEPAGQIEISIKPCCQVPDIDRIYKKFLDRAEPILKERGMRLINLGYTPRSNAGSEELIPKTRYELMDKYFKSTGTMGRNMMRATASTQVSIDFSDETDCVKKLRTANLLTPVFSLMTDNAPFFEGKRCAGRMLRTKIWDNVDPARCGTVPGLFDDDFGFMRYAEYIYNSPPILIMTESGAVYTGSTPASEIFRGRELTDAQTEHLLSMFFPDVRLKRYIEIRPADSMPREYAMGYAALIKAIFVTDAVPCLPDGLGEDDIARAKTELSEKGFEGSIYGMPVSALIDDMLDKAEKALGADDKKHLAPLAAAARKGRSVYEDAAMKGIYNELSAGI